MTPISTHFLKRFAIRGLVGLCFFVQIFAFGCVTSVAPVSVSDKSPLIFAPTDQLRIATYNIRHGRGIDDQVNLERIAAVIQDQDIDIIFLQEVDNNWPRSGHVDQVQQLAELTGLEHTFFAPALQVPIGRTGKRTYGNAVLSRYPLVEAEAISLPRRALNEPRNLLRVQWLPKPETTITLWGTHLSIDSIERAQQFAAIQALAPAKGFSFLLGDLNVSPAQNGVQTLLQGGWIDLWSHLNGDAGSTFPSDRPTTRIDYILATPQSIGTVRYIAAPATLASDHLPLVMEIDLSGA